MKPIRAHVTFAAVCAALSLAVTAAAAQQPYYKGKRLTVLINFAAGGPADIESRIFAKHLVKHIDGAPNLVIQNMDGAGGLIGAQYLGEVAAKDGTVLGALTGTAWIYASDPARWRVDFRKYEFIARSPSTTIHFVRTDVAPGMRDAGRHREGAGPDRRRALRRHLEGPAHAARARHAGRAAPIRHRLSLVAAGAARAPARRDPHVRGIAAELSLGRRAATDHDRHRDPGLVRRDRRPAGAVGPAGGADDPVVPAALQEDQGQDAVGRVLGGLSHALRDEQRAAAAGGAAAGRAERSDRGACAGRSRGSRTTRSSPPSRGRSWNTCRNTRPRPT